jgi:Na+-translocating ferredoxin:NAD+ oxidoreductase RnfC subunit
MVAVGDRVAKGDIIAGVNVDELGSNLHASISGTIAYIDEKIIRIESH